MKNRFLYILILSQFFILSCSNNIKNELPDGNNSSVDSIGKHHRDSLSSEYNNSGNYKFQSQDYQGAIEEYSKAISITQYDKDNENYIYALAKRGDSKFLLHDYAGAIPDYSKVIEKDPTYAKSWYGTSYFLRGMSKLNLQDYHGSIVDFNAVINMDHKYSDGVAEAEVYYSRGFARLHLNQKDSACLDLSRAGELGQREAYELIKQYCN